MPALHSEAASRGDATRHFVYGAHETFIDFEAQSRVSTTTVMGGSSASSFEITFPTMRDGVVRIWPDDFVGLEVVGFARAAGDTIEPTATIAAAAQNWAKVGINLSPKRK